MNSYKKGTDFEIEVYENLKKELIEGRLLVNPANSKIYRKKGYFSRDRQKNIITDISIEVNYGGESEMGILIVVECKNYNHPIPVDDLEEFHTKVSQIAGLNVKAIFATTASLQISALNFAKAKGIAVIRILPEEQIHFVLHFSFRDMLRKQTKEFSENNQLSLLDQNYNSKGRGIFGDYMGHEISGWKKLFTDLKVDKLI